MSNCELIARLQAEIERERALYVGCGWQLPDVQANVALLIDCIAALSSLALAERGEGWFRLDPDNLPKRKLLLTNNLTARDAFDQMSHVWIGTPFKADNPERDGSIVTFDEDIVRVSSITHAHELPPAPASGRGA